MEMSHEQVDDEAAQLSVPVFWVHGARDAFVPTRNARRCAQRIPDARFDVRETDGHVSYLLAQGSTLPLDIYEFLTV
jgi:pimeloyl-ACP methyl ester carboxylesterase